MIQARTATAAIAILVVAFGALVAAGCGGGDSSRSTADLPATSTSQGAASTPAGGGFATAAKKICAAAEPQTKKLKSMRTALTKTLASSPSAAGAQRMQALLGRIAAAEQSTTAELARAPGSSSAEIAGYLASRRETANATGASADAFGVYAAQLDQASVDAITKAQTTEVAADARELALARQLDLTSCGALTGVG